jgi:hypothetical protein
LRSRQATLLRGIASGLRSHADSLAAIAHKTQDIESYRPALIASRNDAAACRSMLAVADSGWTTCRVRADLAEARAERLDSIVRAGLKVGRCRLGFLPCPSRGLTFVGGTVLGFWLGGR